MHSCLMRRKANTSLRSKKGSRHPKRHAQTSRRVVLRNSAPTFALSEKESNFMLPMDYFNSARRSKSTSSAKIKPKQRSPRSSCSNIAPSPPLIIVSEEALAALLAESPSSSETTGSVSANNVESTRPSISGHFQQGLTCSSSSAFHDTDRNSPHTSSQSPSSTGATRGANSSGEEHRAAHSSSGSMSHPRRTESSSSNPSQSAHQDSRASDATRPRPSIRHAASAPVQPSFSPPQSFPPHSFYPSHPPQEAFTQPPYPPPPSHGPPGSAYLGQYMSSQPPHSLSIQPSMGYYSQAFALPGIHAHDPSAIPLPFPSLAHGYTFAPPPPPPPADSDPDNTRASSFPSSRPPPPIVPSAQPISQQHAFAPPPPPLHFPHAPSPTRYAYHPSHTYQHSSPTIYSYAPNPYPPPFYSQPASPEDASKGGTWYYVPPSRGAQYDASAYPGLYAVQGYQAPVQMNRSESYPPPASTSAAAAAPPPPQSGQLDSLQSSHPQLQSQDSSLPPPSPSALRHGPTSFTPISSNFTSSSSQSNRSPKKKLAADMPFSPLPASRKSYHPAPPVNRSEWVMWVGNVPSDATHDEVWRFFNQSSPPPQYSESASAVLTSRLVQPSSASPGYNEWGGVSSVFLISRSNCAFINFESQAHLNSAIAHFNGKPLRPLDPKCPRLVCRVRRKEDDLEAGVGAQRHRGMHTRWVAEQLELERKSREGGASAKEDAGFFVDAPPTSPSTYLAASSSSSDPSPPIHSLSHIDDPHTPITPLRDLTLSDKDKAGGPRSFSSTNSSLLREYFPKRYFILKSLTPFDLDFSIQTGVWATQPHNEGILDQAYRTSKDVYLIFSANKSGEFFGYARMAGPILPRNVDGLDGSTESFSSPQSQPPPLRRADSSHPGRFLTPSENKPLVESPMPTPGQNPQLAIDVRGSQEAPAQGIATAPAEPHQPHRRLSRPNLTRAVGTYPDQGELRYAMVEPSLAALRTHAPVKSVTLDGKVILEKPGLLVSGKMAHSTSGVINKLADVKELRLDTYGGGALEDLRNAEKEYFDEQGGGGGEERPVDTIHGKGREFKIEWIRTEKLPFTRTKHLRNPWNHGREVKVSRDGTEIEPKVGQQLLDEWDTPAPLEQPAASGSSPPSSPVRTRSTKHAAAGGGGGAGGAGAGTSAGISGGTQPSSLSATPAYLHPSRHNRPRPERHRPE